MTEAQISSPIVSIIIVNWNAARDSLISINSCKQQTFRNFEIIVVDNGSSDNSKSVLAGINGIRLVELDANRGFGGGVNAGLRAIDRSPERLILLLNNDAAMEPTALEQMVSRMTAEPTIGIMGGMVRDSETGEIQFPGGGNINYLTGSTRPNSKKTPDFISGAFMLIRSNTIVSIGEFCEDFFMYWEDVDFSVRARTAGWRLGVVLNAIAFHKGMGSTGARSPSYDYYFTRSAIKFFWSRTDRKRLIPIVIIVSKKIIKRIIFGPRKNLRALFYAARDGFFIDSRASRWQ